jgi:hypothetical protein
MDISEKYVMIKLHILWENGYYNNILQNENLYF